MEVEMEAKADPNRIKELREERGISQEKLATAIGCAKNSVQNYENRQRKIPGDILIKLAVFFGVSSDYILMQDDTPSADGYVNTPIYGEIAAGTPIDMMEIDAKFPVPLKIRDAHPNCGLLRVCGDSFNRSIPNGYYALIDFDQKEPNERDAFAVCVNGYAATIKRVKKLANGFELIPYSYDPTYTPTVYDYNKDDTDEITIIGKVVWATMPFDYEI
jgi:repressor LexA